MISSAQASEYIAEVLGSSVPAFALNAARERVETAEAAMEAVPYAEADIKLMQAMAVAIIATAGGARRIQSQGAPSGAQRAFMNDKDALTNMRRSLAAMDTASLLTDIVGPDPAAGTLFLIAA